MKLQKSVWDDHKVLRSDSFVEERQNLAAAFRWFTRLDMNEGVANHFSYVPDETNLNQFYVNRYAKFFGNMRAKDLLLCDLEDSRWQQDHERALVGKGYDSLIDPTAYAIHGAIHKRLGKKARCIMHLHPKYGTAFACLQNIKESKLPPIDQTTARFFNRLTIVESFGGMGLAAEGERLGEFILNDGPSKDVTERLPSRSIILANHGTLVISETIEGALHELFYLEMGIRAYMVALSTQRPLNILSDEVAEETALSWEAFDTSYAKRLMLEVRERLDKDEPDYAHFVYDDFLAK